MIVLNVISFSFPAIIFPLLLKVLGRIMELVSRLRSGRFLGALSWSVWYLIGCLRLCRREGDAICPRGSSGDEEGGWSINCVSTTIVWESSTCVSGITSCDSALLVVSRPSCVSGTTSLDPVSSGIWPPALSTSLYLDILGVSNFPASYHCHNMVNIPGVSVSLSTLATVPNIVGVLGRGSSIVSLGNGRVRPAGKDSVHSVEGTLSSAGVSVRGGAGGGLRAWQARGLGVGLGAWVSDKLAPTPADTRANQAILDILSCFF